MMARTPAGTPRTAAEFWSQMAVVRPLRDLGRSRVMVRTPSRSSTWTAAGARSTRAMGAGGDDGPDARGHAAHGSRDLVADGGREAVARLGAIEGDGADAVAVLDLDVGCGALTRFGHRLSSGVAGLGAPDGPRGSGSNIHSSLTSIGVVSSGSAGLAALEAG